MWDKIKGWLERIAAVLVPILGALAYIFTLRRENETLRDSLAVQQAKEKLGEVLGAKDDAEKKAASVESDYESLREQYVRQSTPGDVRPSTDGVRSGTKKEG